MACVIMLPCYAVSGHGEPYAIIVDYTDVQDFNLHRCQAGMGRRKSKNLNAFDEEFKTWSKYRRWGFAVALHADIHYYVVLTHCTPLHTLYYVIPSAANWNAQPYCIMSFTTILSYSILRTQVKPSRRENKGPAMNDGSMPTRSKTHL